MALKSTQLWSIVLLLAMSTASTLGRISKKRTVLHGHSKIENASFDISRKLKERRLLGRFSGSKLIRTSKSKLAFKKVKNLKNTFSLPPGRNLSAVHSRKVERTEKAAKINSKNLDIERQLKRKGKDKTGN